MLNICNIYPTANQDMYPNEKMVMILAHLAKKGLYKVEPFSNNQYVIMDNGLFEGEQVSHDVQTVMDIAKENNLPVNEFIIPDVANNTEETIKWFEDNMETVKAHPEFNFMFVAQATNSTELKRAIDYINQYKDSIPNLTVGISKLSPMDRTSDENIEIYKTCAYPIHFLGLKKSFEEVRKVKDIIRSTDSCQLAYIVKNEDSIPEDLLGYERAGRREEINLETDILDMSRLEEIREALDNARATSSL